MFGNEGGVSVDDKERPDGKGPACGRKQSRGTRGPTVDLRRQERPRHPGSLVWLTTCSGSPPGVTTPVLGHGEWEVPVGTHL